jgi:hypothetical protein
LRREFGLLGSLVTGKQGNTKRMRRTALIGAAVAAVLGAGAAPATGQAWIGQVLMPTNQNPSDKCYDPNFPQKPAALQDRQSRANVAIREYLALAAGSADVSRAYASKHYGRWLIDGVDRPLQAAADPWAARTARVEQISFFLSNQNEYDFIAAWRAIAADGSTLGYYDALMQRGPHGSAWILVLKLTSATRPPPQLSRFCRYTGDIEKWQEAQARRAAERAEKAARAAADR